MQQNTAAFPRHFVSEDQIPCFLWFDKHAYDFNHAELLKPYLCSSENFSLYWLILVSISLTSMAFATSADQIFGKSYLVLIREVCY